MKFRHNKKRNTAFLFEALIREVTKAVAEDNKEREAKIIKIIKEQYLITIERLKLILII